MKPWVGTKSCAKDGTSTNAIIVGKDSHARPCHPFGRGDGVSSTNPSQTAAPRSNAHAAPWHPQEGTGIRGSGGARALTSAGSIPRRVALGRRAFFPINGRPPICSRRSSSISNRLPRPTRVIGNVNAAARQRSAEQVGFIGRTMINKLYYKVISKPLFRSYLVVVFYQHAL